MERHEQYSRHTASRPNGFQDTDFASSTLRRPVAGQNAQSTRDSRVASQNHSPVKRKYEGAFTSNDEDEDEGSPDEIDFLSYRAKGEPVVVKRKPSSQVTKPKKVDATSKAAIVELAMTPSPPAKLKRPSKPPKADIDTDSEDELSLFAVTLPTARKQPVKKAMGPAATRHEGRAKAGKKTAETKKKQKKPTFDIKEIPDSGEDSIDEAMTNNTKQPVLSHSPYKPHPFPMDLSFSPLAGSSRASSSTPQDPMSGRASGSSRSRNRQQEIESAGSSDSDLVDTTFTYTQAVKLTEADPKSLCPFCDDKLPESPSEVLLEMLEKLKLKATPDPRYGNSLGLKLDMSKYISFCARHNAESEDFPRGQKYGWPTTLVLSELADRIWELQLQLERIIDDPDEGTFFRPLQEMASKYGKSAVTGAKGSWATFENASTGYYGEQGLALITQVLFDMFPSIPADKIFPLELSNYYSLVLVPETALLLIQDDLREKQGYDGVVTRSQALKVLRKSTKYGLAIFPVTEAGQANAGDDIARKRARKMRKLRDQEAEEERTKSSSQNTERETDIIVDLSSDSDPPGDHKTPVQRKRKVQPTPLESVNGASKASKRRAQEETFRRIMEPSQPPVERKLPKKRNLTAQPGGFASLSDVRIAKRRPPDPPRPEKDSYSWLLNSSQE